MTYACLRNYRPEYAALRQVSFAPSSLFKAGDIGAQWDFAQATAYTTPVGDVLASAGDPIGLLKDRSAVGSAYDLSQAASPARPILRVDASGNKYAEFDLVDDILPTTLPAISGGTILIATSRGIWIDDFDSSAGSWQLGITTYTDGAGYLFSVLADAISSKLHLYACLVIDRVLTTAEKNWLVNYYKCRCSKDAVVVTSTNLFTGYTTLGAGWSESAGEYTHVAGTGGALYQDPPPLSLSKLYLITRTVSGYTGGNGYWASANFTYRFSNTANGTASSFVIPTTTSGTRFAAYGEPAYVGTISNISVREVILP